MHYLEFERPIAELEGKIVELKKLAEEDPNMDINDPGSVLQRKGLRERMEAGKVCYCVSALFIAENDPQVSHARIPACPKQTDSPPRGRKDKEVGRSHGEGQEGAGDQKAPGRAQG